MKTSPVDLLVMPPSNSFINGDCLEYMKICPDKHFGLAIVDPPYGINAGLYEHAIGGKERQNFRNTVEEGYKKYKKSKWDNSPPDKDYFEELFRISKNQIIWGANYFVEYLGKSKGWIYWDKKNEYTFNFSHGELAYTSFDKRLLSFSISSKAETRGGRDRIHPTQKPVGLYRRLLKEYATADDLILDTHVGSGSSLIACVELGFDYIGFEIDKEYHEMAKARLGRATRKYELEFEAV